MKYIRGGLKLKDETKKGFTPVYDMLNRENSLLYDLNMDSRMGFLFTLDVQPENSEYLGIIGNDFTGIITKYVLKFSVLSDEEGDPLEEKHPFRFIEKHTDTEQNMFYESKIQMSAWLESIEGGKPEICPSVANFSIFDNKESQSLLHFLINKYENTSSIFTYLLSQIQKYRRRHPLFKIGVITMPIVENSETFYKYSKVNVPTPPVNQLNEAYIYLTAQTLRLTLKLNIFHFDLHTNNSLVTVTDNHPTIKLIDFGKASKLNDNSNDLYFKRNIDEKLELHKNYQGFYNRISEIVYRNNNDEKVDFINEVLNNMKEVDIKKNGEYYDWDEGSQYYGRFQMTEWFTHYYTLSNDDKVSTFNLLVDLTSINGEDQESLQRQIDERKEMMEKDVLFDFNKEISHFKVNFPGPENSIVITSPVITPIKNKIVRIDVNDDNNTWTLCDETGACILITLGSLIVAMKLAEHYSVNGGSRKKLTKRKRTKRKRY